MVSQQDRRQQTRQRLLDAAQALFVERGFEATTTDMILAAAKSSKGAMYHHFDSKADMLAAIYAVLSEHVITVAVAGRDPHATPLQGLIQATALWLEQVSAPDMATLLLEQGPAVLGLQRARAIEERYSLATVSAALRAAQKAGEIKVTDIYVSARMLNALLAEAALLRWAHGVPIYDDVDATIDSFFDSLRA